MQLDVQNIWDRNCTIMRFGGLRIEFVQCIIDLRMFSTSFEITSRERFVTPDSWANTL